MLVVHKDYIDIEQPKNGVLMDRINGNFFNTISILSFDDMVFFVKPTGITKLNLNTGALTHREIPSKII